MGLPLSHENTATCYNSLEVDKVSPLSYVSDLGRSIGAKGARAYAIKFQAIYVFHGASMDIEILGNPIDIEDIGRGENTRSKGVG